MGSTKNFPVEDILTFTTGKITSHRPAEAISGVCAHLTGGPLTVAEIDIFYNVIRDEIVRQHPDLADAQPPEPGDNPGAWITQARRAYGTERTLTPMSGFDTDTPENAQASTRTGLGPERENAMAKLRDFHGAATRLAGPVRQASAGFAKLAEANREVSREARERNHPALKVIGTFTGITEQPGKSKK